MVPTRTNETLQAYWNWLSTYHILNSAIPTRTHAAQNHILKGQFDEIFLLSFFTDVLPLNPFLSIRKLFEFGFEFEDIVAIGSLVGKYYSIWMI